MNAAVFEKYALEKLEDIFCTNDIAVMVGGTGLYIKTFCQGIDAVPSILPGIKEHIMAGYEANGLEWLQAEVQEKDPAYFLAGETRNPRRLMRALEVVLSTGKSIIYFQTQQTRIRDFTIIKTGLELPRADLYERINNRVDMMIHNGLLTEVKDLAQYQHLNALQTVGYKELFDHLNGKTSLPRAIESIKLNTRHYAKRQMTWFKKDAEVQWCAPEFYAVKQFLKNKGIIAD